MLLLSLIAFVATAQTERMLATNDDGTACANNWITLTSETLGTSCIFTNAHSDIVDAEYPKIAPAEAAATCESIDPRSTLLAIFSAEKSALLLTKLEELRVATKLKGDDRTHTISGLPSGVLMKDGEIDPWFEQTPKIEIAQDYYAVFEHVDPTTGTILSADNSKELYYICELCLESSLDKCGSRAQRTSITGKNEFPKNWGTCDAPRKWKRVSHLVCQDCRCWGASKKTRLFRNVTGKADVPYRSRKDCEVDALAQGFDHYSWMPMGFKTACIFGTEFSNTLACGDLKQTKAKDGLKRDWSIYQAKKMCVKECEVELDEVECKFPVGDPFPESDPRYGLTNATGDFVEVGGCKCLNTNDIKYHPQKQRFMSKEACGAAAQANGYKYINWQKDKKWCYFGRSRGAGFVPDGSGDVPLEEYPNNKCNEENHVLTIDSWSIHTVKCKAMDAGFYLAEVGKTCKDVCDYHDLECTEEGLRTNDVSVNTQAGLFNVLRGGGLLTEAQIATFDDVTCATSDSGAVPLIALSQDPNVDPFCAITKTANSKEWGCQETPTDGTQKQRVCYCINPEA